MALTLRSGRIAYLTANGDIRGQEWFQITRDNAGVLTGRSLAVTFDSGAVRDVSLAWTREYQLLDASVRLRTGPTPIGTGYYVNRDGILGVVADTATGREEQAVVLLPPYTFESLAVAFEAWHFFQYDHAHGDRQHLNAFTTSSSGGADGLLGTMTRYAIAKEAAEVIRVGAGEFETTRWRLLSDAAPEPGLLIWTHSEDKVLVRLSWPDRKLRYELAEYSERRLNVP